METKYRKEVYITMKQVKTIYMLLIILAILIFTVGIVNITSALAENNELIHLSYEQSVEYKAEISSRPGWISEYVTIKNTDIKGGYFSIDMTYTNSYNCTTCGDFNHYIPAGSSYTSCIGASYIDQNGPMKYRILVHTAPLTLDPIGGYVPAILSMKTATPTPTPVPNGIISVSTTPVNGDIWVNQGYKGKGSWSGIAATNSIHVVEFKDYPGYITPSSQSVTVNEGQTTYVTGIYIPIPVTPTSVSTGIISVVTTPISGDISVSGGYKGAGSWSGSVSVGYGNIVSFGDYQGYIKPSPQTVVVNAGQTTYVTGTYLPIPPVPNTPTPVPNTPRPIVTATPAPMKMPTRNIVTPIFAIVIGIGAVIYIFKKTR